MNRGTRLSLKSTETMSRKQTKQLIQANQLKAGDVIKHVYIDYVINEVTIDSESGAVILSVANITFRAGAHNRMAALNMERTFRPDDKVLRIA